MLSDIITRQKFRLFVALPLPEYIIHNLFAIKKYFPDLKFSGQLHLTLSFIGYASVIDNIAMALSEVEKTPFSLTLAGVGFFRRGILWAGIDPVDPVGELKERVDQSLARSGYAPERRPYRPHITLSRMKRAPSLREKELLKQIKLEGKWLVNEFRLYESVLKSTGAVHKAIKSYML